MKDLINKTGVGPFTTGGRLSSLDVNAINDTVNSLVEVVNTMLKSSANINLEEGAPTAKYSLIEAAGKIVEERRTLGMRIFFKETEENRWGTWVYNGSTVNDSDWKNPDNWFPSADTGLIDGGEW